jgi:hypothetical protein
MQIEKCDRCYEPMCSESIKMTNTLMDFIGVKSGKHLN